jgi:hypothetical protein
VQFPISISFRRILPQLRKYLPKSNDSDRSIPGILAAGRMSKNQRRVYSLLTAKARPNSAFIYLYQTKTALTGSKPLFRCGQTRRGFSWHILCSYYDSTG